MLKNFLTVAIRNFFRQKTYSFLNVLGLSLGIACILLLGLHVKEELSYDKNFPKHDRIYRVVSTEWSKSSPPLAGEMMKYFPQISTTARFSGAGQNVWHTTDGKKGVMQGYFADSSVMQVFDLQTVLGDPFSALSIPGSIVLTRSAAFRFFGKADPIGQKLVFDDKNDLFVKAVIEDLPANTHLHFDYLIPMHSFYNPGAVQNRNWMFGWTYILLRHPEDIQKVNARLKDFYTAYRHDMSPTDAAADAAKARLQPITDIHLHSDLIQEMGPNSNILYIYIFIAVAILIGLIAGINFVNLFTTQALKRLKEIAVRKVLGAARWQITGQFLGEALLLTILSGCLAILLAQIALPFYDDLTGRHVTPAWFFLPANLLIIATLVSGIGLLSGLFPALFISGFDTAASLKSNKTPGSPASLLRKSLVVFQFIAAGFLIVSTFLVYRQMTLFHDKQLGFDKEQVAVIRYYGDMKDRLLSHPDWLNTEFLSNPDILAAGTTTNLIGDDLSQESVMPVHREAGKQYPDVNLMRIDDHYLDVLHIPLAEGRNFSRSFHDTTNFIINETAARVLGLQHPLGADIENTSVGRKGKVVGVVKDFNFASLHHQIEPLVMEYKPEWNGNLLVRIRAGRTPQTIAWLRNKIAKIAPSDLFDYGFLDDRISGLYRKEDNMSTILKTFSIFSILISCLGLFGLAAYAAEIRTREIGIRKVIGASTTGLVRLLSLDFITPVLIGNLLSWPLSWWAIHVWLREFSYRIDVGWSVFVLSLVLTLVIALLTIGFRCWRAATANPVQALRSE
ncbi:ABC transporter permease [Puia dinghuensis]|uniref:ABC transporter permease n=1 Tax=Puia dinghuensis TaxID=1792502 RepID=A0A8J2XW60_9BACT|nr:FtsX-like permease family protein [Puia dinghuensis]GGB17108.1 ABC transporter permease [Puia dinghuensis]